MHNYTAFVYGALKASGGKALEDGGEIASQCLEKLKGAGDVEQFPPKLLILMMSSAYSEADAAMLLEGIHQVFADAGHPDIALVGSSVAAVFFEQTIHDRGILLVCVGSRLIDISIGVGKNASQNPKEAVKGLLNNLRLNDQRDVNPLSNRMLLSFFPDILAGQNGSKAYGSDELHRVLWNSTLCRIPIAGGVASGYVGDDGRRPGLQFCGRQVYTDALVAAQIDTGTPLSVSLCRGLEVMRDKDGGLVRLRVKSVSKDGNYIEGLEDSHGKAWNHVDNLFLSEDSSERDFIVAKTDPSNGGRYRITDKVSVRDWVQVRQPGAEMLLNMASDIVTQANKRVHIEYPLACLSLICSSYFHNREAMSLDITNALRSIEGTFPMCVGGFVDGEAGVDFTGRSQFGNWSMVGIGFGDEMRDRTPIHRGFKAQSEYSRRFTETTTLTDAISASLDLIVDTGFPGAMISLVLSDVFKEQNQKYLVGIEARGARFSKIVKRLRKPIDSKNASDAVSQIIEKQNPGFVREAEPDDKNGTLLSQYIIPLRGPGQEVVAVLQIDLGDVRSLSSAQKEVLDSLGAAVSGGINRILNWEVLQLTRQLDEAMKRSLSKATVTEGLQVFIEAATDIFGASKGHVRLLKDDRLHLTAGVGDYYEAAKECRPLLEVNDVSPTREAYSSGTITIVNDAPGNLVHRRLIESCQGHAVEKPLLEVGSYANTPFRGEGSQSAGTISLISVHRWFFLWQHEHSLEGLGERVGFLVEHLGQKEKTAEANRSFEFLLHASPQLHQVKNLDDVPRVLSDATQRFRAAAQAHVASLYIWDELVGSFILRAESGWHEPKWLNAARYAKHQGWLDDVEGNILRFSELNIEGEAHARQMFGDNLRNDSVISAIKLPIVLPGKLLGFLVLYRMDTPGDDSSFTKVGFPELYESTDSIAALLSILLSHHRTAASDRLQEYLKKISEIFLREDGLQVLEGALCELIVEMFSAERAEVFFFNDIEPTIPISGFPREAGEAGWQQPDALLAQVRGQSRPEAVLLTLNDEERADPDVAATEGYLTRQCLPIYVEQKTAGVLDIRWSERPTRTAWKPVRYSPRQLRILGTVIGSAYNRYKLTVEKEAERRSKEKERRIKEQQQRGVDAMNMMQVQSEHYLRNLLTALGFVPRALRTATSDSRRAKLEQMVISELEAGHSFVKHLLKVAPMLKNLDLKQCDVRPLLQEILIKEKASRNADGVEEIFQGFDAVGVFADFECLKQALTNIVDNALDAIKKTSGRGPLLITAVTDESSSQVRMIFENEGGMHHKTIHDASNGKWELRGRRSSGVFIAKQLIEMQGGSFNIESDEKTRTRVSVSLPLSQLEEED
jgi:signal transduction histidine kinase